MMPRLDDFRSADMTFRTGELFNPLGLTNFLGSLQAAPDVMGIQHLTFPPFSHGDSLIGLLTVNDTCIHTSGIPVTHRWRPDRIERTVVVDGLDISTQTVMGVGTQSVTIALTISNKESVSRDVQLRIRTGPGVIQSTDNWKTPYSPKEGPAISVTPWEGTPPPETLVQNRAELLDDRAGFLYSSRTSEACSIQATVPRPDSVYRTWLEYAATIEPSGSFTLYYCVVVGETASAVRDEYEQWRLKPAEALEAAAIDWQAEIDAVFTPGNSRYSGHLPTLATSNEDIRRIYHNAIIGLVYHKRIHPRSAYGRTYVTLMPRYWVTTSFMNDWAFSAYMIAMLDPECLRTQIELWLERDIYAHFGTEYVSGMSSGNWYSCNDYSMVRLITTYIRVTGNRDWLETTIGEQTVLEHLGSMAGHYKTLDTGHGLADYGDRNSLLEAVGSYTHEVAAVNAANVWILRELAALYSTLGDTDAAASLEAEAADYIPNIQKLYVAGEGYWYCRQPDGALIRVRHIWDFIHVLNFLSSDLPPKQVAEMHSFFERELLHDNWAAALSPHDEDVSFSYRLDHQWNGSWPGWVAFALRALFRTGRTDLLNRWLPGIARSANQGPYSQAHFVETYAEPIEGGARKGPTEWPYINDWATICVGGFFELVVLDLFGVELGFEEYHSVDQGVLQPGDTLRNVAWHGRSFDVEIN